jgi:hypothetical protein
MWEHFIIMAALSALKDYIKNPAKAAALKEALIEIRDAINVLFPSA